MKTLLAALAALGAAAPTLAADFSGPRIEANVGWDHPRATVDLNGLSAHAQDNGVVYGGEAGYDFRFGPLVAGVVAGIDGTSTKSCTAANLYTSCLKEGRDFAAGARVGTVIAPRILLYAKGEYVNVRLRDAFQSAVNSAANFSTSDDRGGYRLGAGLEFAVTSNVYVKGEYRYTDYRRDRLDAGATVGGADLSRHQIVGGVGLRF